MMSRPGISPSPFGDHRRSSSLCGGHRLSPFPCDGHRRSPSLRSGHRRSPSRCGGQRRNPSSCGGQRRGPNPCVGQSRTPSPCGGQRRSPSLRVGHRRSPNHCVGHRRSPSLRGGHRRSPNPCGGQRRSPSLRGGHRRSPSLHGDGGKKRSRSSYDGCNSSAELLVKRKRRKINDEMDSFEKQVSNTSAKGAIKGLLVVVASIDDYLADGHEDVTVDVEEVMGMVDDDIDGGFRQMWWTDLDLGFDVEDLLRTFDDDIGTGLQRPEETDCSVESDDQKSYGLEDIVEDGMYGEQRPHKLEFFDLSLGEFLVDDFQEYCEDIMFDPEGQWLELESEFDVDDLLRLMDHDPSDAQD